MIVQPRSTPTTLHGPATGSDRAGNGRTHLVHFLSTSRVRAYSRLTCEEGACCDECLVRTRTSPDARRRPVDASRTAARLRVAQGGARAYDVGSRRAGHTGRTSRGTTRGARSRAQTADRDRRLPVLTANTDHQLSTDHLLVSAELLVTCSTHRQQPCPMLRNQAISPVRSGHRRAIAGRSRRVRRTPAVPGDVATARRGTRQPSRPRTGADPRSRR